jgi:hypothetical protein
MKRFRFPLERVRKWRQDQARLEEMRLRQLYSEMRAAEAERKAIVEESESSRRAVIGRQCVTAEELSSLEAFKKYAAEQVRRLDARRRALAASIEEQQARALEAHRSFQLLDGLHDRALNSWAAARDKEQDELAAELFLARWSQRVRESRSLEGGALVKSTGAD